MGLLGALSPAPAVVVSPVQSPADPLGLKLAAPVDIGGSDAASAAFMSALPALKALVQANVPAIHAGPINAASMALDPSTLRLATDSSVRVYFLSESAGNHNSLGFNTFAPGSTLPTASTPGITSDAQLIFPDASSSAPGSISSANNSIRSSSEPLLAGDFVDLGSFQAGTLLDLFMIAYGAQGGTIALGDETARNFDNFQHIVAFSSPGSPYLIVSFEDTFHGGDQDYNDAVIALEFTPLASQASMSPEPGTWAGLIGLCLMVGWNTLRGKASKRPIVSA